MSRFVAMTCVTSAEDELRYEIYFTGSAPTNFSANVRVDFTTQVQAEGEDAKPGDSEPKEIEAWYPLEDVAITNHPDGDWVVTGTARVNRKIVELRSYTIRTTARAKQISMSFDEGSVERDIDDPVTTANNVNDSRSTRNEAELVTVVGNAYVFTAPIYKHLIEYDYDISAESPVANSARVVSNSFQVAQPCAIEEYIDDRGKVEQEITLVLPSNLRRGIDPEIVEELRELDYRITGWDYEEEKEGDAEFVDDFYSYFPGDFGIPSATRIRLTRNVYQSDLRNAVVLIPSGTGLVKRLILESTHHDLPYFYTQP